MTGLTHASAFVIVMLAVVVIGALLGLWVTEGATPQ